MRIRRPSRIVVLSALALVLVGALSVLTARHEPATAYDTFLSTDYASGGVRAWQTLLTREGIRSGAFVRRPVELDRTIDTLISIAPLPFAGDSGRTDADVAYLARWVRDGGRLVLVGADAAHANAARTQLHAPPLLPDAGARGVLRGPLAGLGVARADFGQNRLLGFGQRSLLGDRNGDLVVSYSLGRGEVVAVSDAQPFTNGELGDAGNARLAYALGRPKTPGGFVAFDDALHGVLVERPWYQALNAGQCVALAFAFAALLLALSGTALRNGPPVRIRPPREPTSAEFIAALAALHERTDARTATRNVLVADALAAAELAPRPNRALADELTRGATEWVQDDRELLACAQRAARLRKESIDERTGDRRRAAFTGGPRARGRG